MRVNETEDGMMDSTDGWGRGKVTVYGEGGSCLIHGFSFDQQLEAAGFGTRYLSPFCFCQHRPSVTNLIVA